MIADHAGQRHRRAAQVTALHQTLPRFATVSGLLVPRLRVIRGKYRHF
jgi:hypothetical protein